MNPDFIVTSPSIKAAYERLMRIKTVRTLGSYYLLELDGKVWWERKSKIEGSHGWWPRTHPDSGWTTIYLPTKAMKKRGYQETDTYWFKKF